MLKKIWEQNSKAFVLPITGVVLALVNEGAEAVGIEFTPDMSFKDVVTSFVGGGLVWLTKMPAYNKE